MKKTSVVVFTTITLATMLASFLAAGPAQAASQTWQATTSTLWNTTSNWSGSVLPASSDEADFTGTLTKLPSVNVSSFLGQFHALSSLGQSFTATIASGQVLTLSGTNNSSTGILIDLNASSGTTVTISGGSIAVARARIGPTTTATAPSLAGIRSPSRRPWPWAATCSRWAATATRRSAVSSRAPAV